MENPILDLGQAIDTYGIPLVLALILGAIGWYARYQVKKDEREAARRDKERKEELKQREDDRLVLTNHLSGMIKDDTQSREHLAGALAKLSEKFDSQREACLEIQKAFKGEVDRMVHGG